MLYVICYMLYIIYKYMYYILYNILFISIVEFNCKDHIVQSYSHKTNKGNKL